MPHAENDMETTPMTNGDMPHSKVLSHLQTYPVVHDSVEAYKSHPYGAKSLSLIHTTYQRLVAPLHPYLQTPYSYLSPYLTRADELGDNGLTKVDDRFPIVKEDTSKLRQTVMDCAGLPLALATKSKDYVLGTWQDEYSKTRGNDGALKNVKALISTELKIGHDGYTLFIDFWNKRKSDANTKLEEKKQ